MRRHQAVSAALPPVPLDTAVEEADEIPSIGVVQVEACTEDPSCDDVEEPIRKAGAEQFRHRSQRSPREPEIRACGATDIVLSHTQGQSLVLVTAGDG